MRYLPFLDGKYSVAPGLQPLKKVENQYDKLVFQIDEQYQHYLQNKQACRDEDIRKYYAEEKLLDSTVKSINHFIVDQLIKEHSSHFSLIQNHTNFILTNNLTRENISWSDDWIKTESTKYSSLFDALACQVQEDFAICQMEGERDSIAALHVCAANHWAPAKKAGKPFNAIHSIVPGMEKTMPHHSKMLLSIVDKGPFTRFAWGIATDDRLNHHPVPPPGIAYNFWKGRRIEEGCALFLRVEKQTLNGFPANQAFFFTIRTYFYPVHSLDIQEKKALVSAIESMSEPALLYKGLSGKVETLQKMILKD